MKENNCGVYAIVCESSDKMYIGSSICLPDRKNTHFSGLRRGKHFNRHMQSAFNKYGKDNFLWTILEYCPEEAVLEREQFWIDTYWESGRLYNTNLRAEVAGRTISEDTRKRLSESHKGFVVSEATRYKLSAAGKGKKASEETLVKLRSSFTLERRQLISKTHKGRKVSQETREKMAAPRRGKKVTEKELVRLRGLNKGRKHSDEIRANKSAAQIPEMRKRISEALKGRKHSAEALAKMKGRRLSDEHKMKISARLKGRTVSEEARMNSARALMGHTVSNEARVNMSAAKIGEKSPAAKLTWEKAREIRSRFSDGENGPSLSSAFGVHVSQIYNIVKGKAWKE